MDDNDRKVAAAIGSMTIGETFTEKHEGDGTYEQRLLSLPEGWIAELRIELDGHSFESANLLADALHDHLVTLGLQRVQVQVDLTELLDPGAPGVNEAVSE